MKASITLSKYVAKLYIGWLSTVTGILSILLILMNYIELFRRAQNKSHITFDKITALVILQFPDLLEQVFPFCVLFATLLLFWGLSRHSEIIVIKSFGQSIWKLLLPVFIIVIAYSTVSLFLINPVSSTFLNKYEQLNNALFQGNKSSMTLSNTGLWFKQKQDSGYAIVQVEKINSDTNLLENITIYNFNNVHQFSNRMQSKKAFIKHGEFELQDVIELDQFGMENKKNLVKWPTTLTLHKIEESFASPNTISFWDLSQFINLMEKSGFSANEHILHWYFLLLKPLLLISMILLGGLYGVRSFYRHQNGMAFLISGIVIAFGMFLLQKIFYGLGKSLTIPPIMAVCAPLVLSMLISLSLLLHYEDK